jgi:transposase
LVSRFVRFWQQDPVMVQNFLACDREQALLLPPSLREWLPADHLTWFVLDVVEEMDLAAFLAEYREDGWGRAAFDPAMMVALVLYAYAIGERSSRRIERRCREDIAFRVICANQVPDHATIARFRVRHERALGEVFGQVLGLCAGAGLESVGVIALDGTKIHTSAARAANRTYEQIVREILEEAAAADADDDARLGDRRGDELPAELADRSSRRARLRAAKERLEARFARPKTRTPRTFGRASSSRPSAGASYVGASRWRRQDRRAVRQGQRHRPGLPAGPQSTWVGSGLQRAGRVHRDADHRRG